MKKVNKLIIIIVFSLLFTAPSAVFAFQPYVLKNETQIRVYQPEVSKAYYGELDGQPVNFYLDSTQPFPLYIGMLLPTEPGGMKNLVVRLYRNGEQISELNGLNFEWNIYYDEFANDEYWLGPEYRIYPADPGEYRIELSRSDENSGKYILAIGEVDSYEPSELFTTIRNTPGMKEFLGRSIFTVFFSITGFLLSCVLLAVGFFLMLVVYVVRRLMPES